jgi:hypothetical protein
MHSIQRQVSEVSTHELSTQVSTLSLGFKPRGARYEEKRTLCQDCECLSAWLLLLRVAVFNALCSLNFSAFGFLYVEYTQALNASKADVGWIPAIQVLVQSFASESYLN